MRRTGFSMIIPSLAPRAEDIALDRLLSPACHYRHPEEVLRDNKLAHSEKRAILASWASDACAVESMPALRLPPSADKPVSFDIIMDALRRLDRGDIGADDAVCASADRHHRLHA